MIHKAHKISRFFFLLVGLILLIMLVSKIGVQTILDDISDLNYRFIWILSISFLWYILYTLGWREFLSRIGGGISLIKLFRIKVAGEAVNTLTPANFVGGDPFRIHLLKKNFATTEAAASVVVDRTIHSLATLVIILVGIAVSFITLKTLPANIRYGIPIATLASTIFILFLLIHQRKGLFSLILAFVRRVGIKRNFSERTLAKFEELDGHIIDFYKASHRGFWLSLFYNIAGRTLGVVEIYLIGSFVSDKFSLLAALVLTALAPLVNAVFTFIPGSIGVMEGAYSGALYLMHLDPTLGISIQIVKRIRSAFWITIGLIFIGLHDSKKVLRITDPSEELAEEI